MASLEQFFGSLDASVCSAVHVDVEEATNQCKQYLQEQGITAAPQLLLADTITSGEFAQQCAAVGIDFRRLWKKLEEFDETYTSMEDTLNGEIIGPDEELKVIEKRYIPHCHNAELRGGAVMKGSRDMKVIMVHGPSGSGKTFFAVKECPIADVQETILRVCTVYLKLGGPFDWEGFEQTVRDKLEEFLNEKTKKSNITITRKLTMRVAVVIDEVYGNGHYLGTHGNLKRVVDSMDKIATDKLLIIAGTGLDQISCRYASARDVFKYDMRPWSINQVFKVANGLGLENEWVDLIAGQGSLSALLSNARSAYFLLDELKDSSLKKRGIKEPNTSEEEWERKMDDALNSHVPQLLDSVMTQYIGHNGLADLNSEERGLVAGAVLKELQESGRSPLPRWPRFDFLRLTPRTLDKDRLERMAFALIDMHVEKRYSDSEEKVCFVSGHTSSVSVTPAMCMVVYELLGVKLSIYHSWSDFELIGAVYAFRQELFACTSFEGFKKWKLVSIGEAFPSTAGCKTVKMPLCGKFTVWRNGEKAPFADVIAPYKLYQLKFTASTSQEVSIDLFEEVGKVGVLKGVEDIMSNEEYRKFHRGEVLLSALYQHWNDDSNEKDKLEEAGGIESVEDPSLSPLYPEILLLGRKTFRHRTKVRSFEVDVVKDRDEANDKFLERYRSSTKTWREVGEADSNPLPILADFHGDEPLRLIFVTNAAKIRLSFSKKGSSLGDSNIVLTAEDVEEDGSLTTSALSRVATAASRKRRSGVSSRTSTQYGDAPVSKVWRGELSVPEGAWEEQDKMDVDAASSYDSPTTQNATASRESVVSSMASTFAGGDTTVEKVSRGQLPASEGASDKQDAEVGAAASCSGWLMEIQERFLKGGVEMQFVFGQR